MTINEQTLGGFPPEPTGPTKQDPYCPVQAVPPKPVPGDPYVRGDYLFYDPADRVVVMAGTMLPYEAWLNAKTRDCCYLEGVAVAGIHLVDDTCTIQERPVMPITVSGMTLSGVPVGAEVTVGNASFDATESTVELEFSLPGVYQIDINLLPYLPWRYALEVQDTDTV